VADIVDGGRGGGIGLPTCYHLSLLEILVLLIFCVKFNAIDSFICSLAMLLRLKKYSYSFVIFQIRLRTGLDFKSAHFDHVRGEAEDWIKMRGLEI
jgi:hypothetical protein